MTNGSVAPLVLNPCIFTLLFMVDLINVHMHHLACSLFQLLLFLHIWTFIFFLCLLLSIRVFVFIVFSYITSCLLEIFHDLVVKRFFYIMTVITTHASWGFPGRFMLPNTAQCTKLWMSQCSRRLSDWFVFFLQAKTTCTDICFDLGFTEVLFKSQV